MSLRLFLDLLLGFGFVVSTVHYVRLRMWLKWRLTPKKIARLVADMPEKHHREYSNELVRLMDKRVESHDGLR
jgi:hypothetical protein